MSILTFMDWHHSLLYCKKNPVVFTKNKNKQTNKKPVNPTTHTATKICFIPLTYIDHHHNNAAGIQEEAT